MKFAALILAIACLPLAGCGQIIIPDKIGNNGLLVGQIYSSTIPNLDSAKPIIISGIIQKQTTRHDFGIRNGTLLLALPPGEYELDGFDYTIKPIYEYGRNVPFYRLDLKKKVKIESGKVTNIGMVVYEGVNPPVFLDNSEEIAALLRANHPSLYASLRDTKFIEAVPRSPAETIDKVRAFALAKRAKGWQWKYEYANEALITSALGSVALLSKDSHGNSQFLQLKDPDTTADFSDCTIVKSRAACLITGDSWLLVRSSGLERKKGPQGVVMNTVAAFGTRGVVAIDDRMRIYTSLDNGDSWTLFEGAMLKNAITRDSYSRASMRSFRVHLGRAGFYLFLDRTDGDESDLVYGDYESGQLRTIPLPKTVANMSVIKETSRGLFVGPALTEFGDDSLHYLPNGETRWQVLPIPKSHCSDMAIFGDREQHIEVRCGGAGHVVEVTMDGGKTWIERTVKFSHFAE